MRKIILFICICAFISCTQRNLSKESKVFDILLPSIISFNYTALNLDFEASSFSDNKVPDKWIIGGDGYSANTDNTTHQNGNASLRITFNNLLKNDFGVFFNLMPLDSVIGKTVRLTGYIKSKDLVDGYAGLWLRVDGEQNGHKVLGFDNMHDRGISGTADWTQVEIEIEIDPSAKAVFFGGLFTGRGTAWFDNLEIYIDGGKYEDPVLPEPKYSLTKKELAALKRYVYPLRTYEPDGGSTDDLEVLKRLVGDSKVVALGEATHGTGEIFKMKNRIIQYLAANEGFDIFSIEANMPESYRLNEYTVEGKGDSRKLVSGMGFWTWDTEEVLDMVEWMRSFNAQQPRVTFTGFDMQFYQASAAIIKDAFKDNEQITAAIANIDSKLGKLHKKRKLNAYSPASVDISKEAAQLKGLIAKSNIDNSEREWLLQNVTILEQYSNNMSQEWRDRCMADNVLWINGRNLSSRIVMWAHNGHVNKTGNTMGGHLKDSLAEDYVTFGFAFYYGSYTTNGKNGLTSYKAQTAYPGTLEYLLNQVDEPIFILDLKKIKADDDELTRWITEKLKFRIVGATKRDVEFLETTITDDFDYIIFIKTSTASKLL